MMWLTMPLVTNSWLHANPSIHLGLTWYEHNPLVTVPAHDLHAPADRHQVDGDHLRETGRGLVIVESLADDFGWSRLASGTGKVMWFSLAIPPRAPEKEVRGQSEKPAVTTTARPDGER